jgi:Transcriptional regulator
MDSTQFQPVSDPLAASFATTYAGVVSFIAVVAEGSFARAADRLGVGRSAVSRNVQKLEDQLNVRLLQRTTRSTSLTREGDLFYNSCHEGVGRIVQAVEEMKDLRGGPPRGHLRIAAMAAFGRKVIAPLLHEFLDLYDGVNVELLLVDRDVDLTSGQIDIAFRHGRMGDSQLIARRVSPLEMRVCASPGYAQKRGLPSTVDDVLGHDCINFRYGPGRASEWEFKDEGGNRTISPAGKVTYNDLELVVQAVLDGQGIAQIPAYLADEHLQNGDLVSCLDGYAMQEQGHYICYQSRQHMPTRMRVFIDFMADRIRTRIG